MGLVYELPPESRFWTEVNEPIQAAREYARAVEAQRAEQRKRLGLGSPPLFPHRRR